MVFRRTIAPAPSGAGSSSLGVSAGAATSSRGQLVARSIGARQAPSTPATAPSSAVQPGLAWAAVAARNAGPSGRTVLVDETHRNEEPAAAPAPAPTRPPRVVSQTPETFSSPLEEGAYTRTEFHPMDAIFECEDNTSAWDRDLRGFSPNYRGNINNPRNRSDPWNRDINCSVFITNLPLGVTVKGLLDALVEIGPFGKVYQTHIMEPSGIHELPGARLTMWDRPSAESVYAAIDSGRLVIGGLTAQVVWDQILRVPHLGRTYLSRVLHIRGPSHIVDVESIYDILNELIVYQTQRVSVLWESEDEREIRWIFGSFYAQAEPARMALCQRWRGNPACFVRAGRDPMEVGNRHMEPSLYDVDPGPDNRRKTRPVDGDDDRLEW